MFYVKKEIYLFSIKGKEKVKKQEGQDQLKELGILDVVLDVQT